MKLRVITWNLQHAAGTFGNRIRLLRHLDERFGPWHLLLLQELTASTWETMRSEFNDAHGEFSWHDEPGPDADTPTGAGLLVRPPLTVDAVSPLLRAPSQKRTLTAVLDTEHGPLAIASCALPPGHHTGPWGQQKVTQSDVIVEWITEHRKAGRRVLVGIDANTPQVDHPNLEQSEFWYEGERRLLGSNRGAGDAVRTHDVTDAYRSVITDEELAGVTALRPEGPLAVSHLRGSYSKVPCRYDYLLASPELRPREVRYLYEEAVAAGSDHALIHGVFDLT